ncbi:hypothetical protein [Acinetobacter puyangensis]|uniref:hypothetical protein n=1 Tax=Acinetobacter puyangensis TaxID=1096779 RepID=UPI003A4E2D79
MDEKVLIGYVVGCCFGLIFAFYFTSKHYEERETKTIYSLCVEEKSFLYHGVDYTCHPVRY